MKKILKCSIALSMLAILFGSSTLSVKAAEVEDSTEPNSISRETNQNHIPVYSSLEEWDASGDDSDRVRIKNTRNDDVSLFYLGGYSEYIYTGTKYSWNTRIGYHPDFKNWLYVDAYHFSTQKRPWSASVNLNWGSVLSVGVSVSKGNGSGFEIKADSWRKSRPWVRADVKTRRYDMELYDEFGRFVKRYRNARTKSTTSDVQIFVDYR